MSCVFLCLQIEAYTYYGTNLDSMDHLNYQTNHHTSEMTAVAAQFAGQMALRLIHDRLLNLDVSRYSSVISSAVGRVYRRISQLKWVGLMPFFMLLLTKLFFFFKFILIVGRFVLQSGQLKEVNSNWLSGARGSFQRAADALNIAITNTDLNDKEACRILNDRILRVRLRLSHLLSCIFENFSRAPLIHC